MATSIPKFRPRTEEERAALRRKVEERVANATPEEKARVKALREAAAKLNLRDQALK